MGAAQNYEFSEIHKYMDFINIMAYDFYGGGFSNINKLNAPIVDCQSRACGRPFDISTGLQEFIAGGIPPNKLVLGLVRGLSTTWVCQLLLDWSWAKGLLKALSMVLLLLRRTLTTAQFWRLSISYASM